MQTDLADRWDTDFVNYEIEEGHTQYSSGGVLIGVPGAFQILVGISEYQRALEIADSAPEAFIYPGICGWREVCRAFTAVGDRSDHYVRAAEFFASDVLPEPHLRSNKPYWSGSNSQTLAPYFRARAVLAKPTIDADDTIKALRQAAREIQPDSGGFVYLPSRTLAILVHGLGSFLETKDTSVLDKLAQDYQKEIKFWNSYAEDDDLLLRGLGLISQAIEGFRYDPVEELKSGRLSDGIDILESIPESSQFWFVSRLGRTFSETALEISQGTTYGEVAAALKRIVRECFREFSELIADDKAVDLVAMLDARRTLQGYPHKFVKIAYKQYAGYPLANDERAYLYRHKVQKRLVLA